MDKLWRELFDVKCSGLVVAERRLSFCSFVVRHASTISQAKLFSPSLLDDCCNRQVTTHATSYVIVDTVDTSNIAAYELNLEGSSKNISNHSNASEPNYFQNATAGAGEADSDAVPPVASVPGPPPEMAQYQDPDNKYYRMDEMHEDPPKRPFHWWNRYHSANGAFYSTENPEIHTGPHDAIVATDDGSCGHLIAEPGLVGSDALLPCGPQGFCQQGACVCVQAYTGKRCHVSTEMPGFNKSYKGHFLMNRELLNQDHGIRFPTDQAADPPPLRPFIRLPVSKEVWQAAPKEDLLGQSLHKSCAVVGGSGILRFYKFGGAIDQHDLIVRFNKAPTKRWERYVGSRTSLRFVTPSDAGWHEANESSILPISSKPYMYLQVVYHRRHPLTKLYILTTHFDQFVAGSIPSVPSIGYLAVMVALHRCAQVTVYGFHHKSSAGIPYHYYDTENPKKAHLKHGHNLDYEFNQISRLAMAGRLTVAEPCLIGCSAETAEGDVPCPNCAPGSMCYCQDGVIFPWPVARPGFCRHPGEYSCFYRCPGGSDQCKGGMHGTKCPKSLSMRVIHSLGLKCATEEDAARPLDALNATSVAINAVPLEKNGTEEEENLGALATDGFKHK
ncbi:hypothetical protein CYMTET_18532 [Cymbomonas tetramitiformis]|uniref:Uncharacterized protein n=1 Tax=Cymbomonas tetramitiformis TaxID=36881 RepID=A0AAE0G7V2_9CHLO|nr:hypothetical protein CYMTET_18532 [Cymbomonas tetramitiformis]